MRNLNTQHFTDNDSEHVQIGHMTVPGAGESFEPAQRVQARGEGEKLLSFWHSSMSYIHIPAAASSPR